MPTHGNDYNQEASDAVAKYPEEFLKCRAKRHQFPDEADNYWVEEGLTPLRAHQELTCQRCGTVRVITIEEQPDGILKKLKTPSYRRPEGYNIRDYLPEDAEILPTAAMFFSAHVRASINRQRAMPRKDSTTPLTPGFPGRRRARHDG